MFKNWRKVATAIDWRALSKLLDLGLDLAEDVVITPMDLWYVDMAAVLKYLFTDPTLAQFGYLTKMATTSRGSIAALLAVSFCERINSVANQVMTKGNTLLGTDEVNMLTVLRMNREFIEYYRERFPELLKQQHLKMTVLKPEDNAADSDSESTPVMFLS